MFYILLFLIAQPCRALEFAELLFFDMSDLTVARALGAGKASRTGHQVLRRSRVGDLGSTRGNLRKMLGTTFLQECVRSAGDVRRDVL